ncbi:MAG: ribonuclease HII [Desulfoprunum sp.]|nr:ribonuclease HII [Desulfoprunum sp.]
MGSLLTALTAIAGPMDSFHHERILSVKGYRCVAGTDEAGRGPLAGPVVAACIVLPPDCDYSLYRDSKTLTHAKRLQLCSTLITIGASIGVGIVSVEIIDTINILRASLLAMKLAVDDLATRHPTPDFILVDGKFTLPSTIAQEALIKGDSRSASIAAASNIAKVQRDALMDELHVTFPQYNFARNKGYPTREHRLAIARYGPCPAHRRTFRGVKEFV